MSVLSPISFLLIMETEPPPLNFSLKNLPGASKIDVVARCILATFPEREDYFIPRHFSAIFTKGQPTALEVGKKKSKTINYDEIAIAAQIKEAITLKKDVIKHSSEIILEERKGTICWFQIIDLANYLQKLRGERKQFIYLHEGGDPFKEELPKLITDLNITFILGGREDLANEREKTLKKFGVKKLSLGTKSYLASTCISKVIYEFEKMME
ncbi:MAG: hypothetical protein GF308_04725 [Candidatus Heimdallarchaeota archaeon]|nr:hypothetical protein [Candidatus Heimdallarchaeota archaeon]